MENNIIQGEITLDGSTKISATSSTIIVTNIIINNLSENYSFILYRGSNNIVPIYRFDLDAGDTVRDSEEYVLNPGEYLKLVSNVPNTTYYVKTSTP